LSISIITDWENGKQDVWTTKIKPKSIELKFASKEALQICNYSNEEWKDAPSMEDVASDIVTRLQWGPIVGHNVQFDIDHIKAALQRYGYRKSKRNEDITPKNKNFRIGYPVIDTCALAYLFVPSERQNLNALREHYGIDTSRAHSADTDAEDCRFVFYDIINNVLDSKTTKQNNS
jgi:DNA polymerase III epsilon subunit-like protein